MNSEYKRFLKEINPADMKEWKNEKQSAAISIIEAFLESDMQMAEVEIETLPQPEQKGTAKTPSTKQDSFASSFYAWKKKVSTKQKFAERGIDVILIRQGQKIALKKKEGKQ
jgi:hypothetical protein